MKLLVALAALLAFVAVAAVAVADNYTCYEGKHLRSAVDDGTAVWGNCTGERCTSYVGILPQDHPYGRGVVVRLLVPSVRKGCAIKADCADAGSGEGCAIAKPSGRDGRDGSGTSCCCKGDRCNEGTPTDMAPKQYQCKHGLMSKEEVYDGSLDYGECWGERCVRVTMGSLVQLHCDTKKTCEHHHADGTCAYETDPHEVEFCCCEGDNCEFGSADDDDDNAAATITLPPLAALLALAAATADALG